MYERKQRRPLRKNPAGPGPKSPVGPPKEKMKSPKPRMRAGKIGDAVKSGAKKVVEGYLKGTQKLADKIQSVLPEVEYDRSGRGGRGRRRPGGR